MKLEDLFVSHKQVDPVQFTTEKPELPRTIYLNLERAQKATQPEQLQQQPVEEESPYKVGKTYDTGYYDWRVKNYTPTQNKKPKNSSGVTQDTDMVIQDLGEVAQDSKTTAKTTSKTTSKTLKSYRNSSDYQAFKKELDIFIDNNPQYRNIKDSLDYLAALESCYKMGIENYAGSKALGWFQFLDSTRKSYNNQSRADFAKDAQAQLKAAAQHYSDLQKQVKNWGGDPNDFVTMYGAWWRPESARLFIKDNTHDYTTTYNESFSGVRKRAQDLFKNG